MILNFNRPNKVDYLYDDRVNQEYIEAKLRYIKDIDNYVDKLESLVDHIYFEKSNLPRNIRTSHSNDPTVDVCGFDHPESIRHGKCGSDVRSLSESPEDFGSEWWEGNGYGWVDKDGVWRDK